MSKFTKGEWIVYDSSMDWGNVHFDELAIGMSSFNEDYTEYYTCHKVIINDTDEEARANAHLIAAAPDMYNKLGELLTFLEVMHEADTSWTIKESIEFHKEIQILLSKARGES